MIQCRARYDVLKKGKAKATASVVGGRSSRYPNDEVGEQGEPLERTRPGPRKRAPAKGKGKQPATPLQEEGTTQAGEAPIQLPPNRPRGRPRKVAQALDDPPKTPEDGGSNAEKVTRPVPRKRGRPPKVKPRESPATTECPEGEGGQNA